MNLARPSTVIALFVVLTLPLMPLQQLFIWFWPRMARTCFYCCTSQICTYPSSVPTESKWLRLFCAHDTDVT